MTRRSYFGRCDSGLLLTAASKGIQMSTKNNACCLPWVKSTATGLRLGAAILLVRDWEECCGVRQRELS